MECRIELESKTGWGEVTEVEIATVTRRVTAATDVDLGLSLTGSKAIFPRFSAPWSQARPANI